MMLLQRWKYSYVPGMLLLLATVTLRGAVAAPATFKPFTLNTPEGKPTALSDVLGKATLVVFFFPSCSFCNTARPHLQRLHEAYKDRGLSMVWVNVVQEQDALVSEWRTRHGFTVPVLLGGRSVDRDYKVEVTPTHYLLDAERQILWRHAGYKAGDEKELERRIRDALAIGP